jgi:hypothetical protein
MLSSDAASAVNTLNWKVRGARHGFLAPEHVDASGQFLIRAFYRLGGHECLVDGPIDIVSFFYITSDIGGNAMSDGPHRSLPMRRAWKELAKRGDQSTYDSEHVAEAAGHALASDFKNEVSAKLISALKDVFTGRDNSLGLPEIALQKLKDAKVLAAGSVFGLSAVAWSIQLVHEGRLGQQGLYDAVGLAAKERGFANTRSVEEHYLRNSNQRRADGVVARLNSAISGLTEGKLGSMLVNPPPATARAPRKKAGLDEGVPL